MTSIEGALPDRNEAVAKLNCSEVHPLRRSDCPISNSMYQKWTSQGPETLLVS